VRWLTLETEHFEIHYPTPLGVVARRAATVCERAHRILSEILEHDVDGRVQVVLTDETDSANGSASSIPFNRMRLFATAPEDLTPLGDYDDWFGVLITHEHTHVLHLDTISGLPAVVNWLLGKSYAPNLIQPGWFIEGLAVHHESAHTAGGRIRSTMFEMYMRMAALEDRLQSIDQLSTSVDAWPRGNSRYLYGSRFVRFLADQYGDEALTRISHEYGRRLVPYALNRAARRATGRGFVELYEIWQNGLKRDAQALLAAVEAEGRVEGRRITTHGDIARSPRFLDDDTIAYYVADGSNDAQIRLLDRDGGNPRQMVRALGNAYVAPAAGGREVYFGALAPHRDIYFLGDLFHHDRETGRTRRLTEGWRVAYPDVSPDGRRVAFTVNGAGTRHLMVADVRDVPGTAEVLVRSPRFGQAYTPRWSPDGRRIAFSLWRRGGYRDIAIVDVASGEVERVTRDRAMDTGPAWAPDGETLYFSSDRTGIANLYAWHLETETLEQLTNVIAGAYSPDVSPDGRSLVYLGYTSYGFDLWRLDLDAVAPRPAAPYVDDRPPPIERGEVVATSRRYRAFGTLYPRNYTLDLASDGFGQQLGITVASSDLVGLYSYSARLGVSLAEGYVNGTAFWTFNRLRSPITLSFFRTVSPRGGLQVAGESRTWIEDAIGGSASIRYDFPGAFHSESLSASYSLTQLRQGEDWGGRLDPNTPPPVLPELGRVAFLRASWSYSDVRGHFYDMSPSEGRGLSVSLSVAHPAIGSQYNAVSFSYSWRRFVEAPWAQHHVFALRYAGGLSGGDLGRRGLFSVGGFSEIGIVDSLVNNVVVGGVGLRGYPPFDRSGTRFQLAQLEYRFPIYRIMRGIETLPAYLTRVHAKLFVDAGDAWFGTIEPRDLRLGFGAELFVGFTLGYYLPFQVRVGFAYGAMEGGGPQVYMHLGAPF